MNSITKTHKRPLIVATTVLISGVAASLAGNLQAINLTDVSPGVGAYVSALIWPLFLFGAIEVMLHTPWVRSWRDGLTKWAGLSSVAAVSLWVSYGHLVHVLTAYGYDTASAHVGPLAIDLTMAMATMALNRIGQARRTITMDETPDPVALATQPMAPEWTAEDAAMLAQWEKDMDALEKFGPSLDMPVPVSPAPALARSNEVKPESVPAAALDYFRAWDEAPKTERPTKKDMNALVAATYKVSERTARRWYDATKTNA